MFVVAILDEYHALLEYKIKLQKLANSNENVKRKIRCQMVKFQAQTHQKNRKQLSYV